MAYADWLPYLISFVTGVGSWVGSYLMATKKSKQELKSLEENNKHEIEKLMKQHEVDINSLKEKHVLEMESKDKEHEYKLQIMQKEHDLRANEQQQKKSNDVMFSAMGGLFNDLLSNPGEAMQKVDMLKNLGDMFKNHNQKTS